MIVGDHLLQCAVASAVEGAGRDGNAVVARDPKIETAAAFRIIDRSNKSLSPTNADRQFMGEAHQVLQAAQEQATAHPNPEEGRQEAEVPLVHAGNQPGAI